MTLINYSVCFLFFALCQTARVSSESAEQDYIVSDRSLAASESAESGEGVRCYCNTAACVSTGYMCRASATGGCYSELIPKSNNARFGCLQHLGPSESKANSLCQNFSYSERDHPPAVRSADRHKLILCCFRDLCNHEDSPLTRLKLNRTIQEGVQESECLTYSSSEVWLKAATIAVPVCGAIILFLLVAVAIRMLRAVQKLSSPYMSHPLPPPHCYSEDRKIPLGAPSRSGAESPLLVQTGNCLVRVDKVEMAKHNYDVCCDIER